MHDVLIIGCGKIAGGFDVGKMADELPLSHAGAFSRHSEFNVAACVDPDDVARASFMELWSVTSGAASVKQLRAKAGSFDVISICSPTQFHSQHLAEALALNPKLIFCEKPVSSEIAETEKWVKACEEAGILLAVNYSRRWAPDVVRLAAELPTGKWGELRSVVGHYNKGMLHNGGHMVDLLRHLFGDVKPLAVGKPLWDCWDEDPSIPVFLEAEDGLAIHLAVSDARDYARFELEIVTSSHIISMCDGGQRWNIRKIAPSAEFEGYNVMSHGENIVGEYNEAMAAAVENLHASINAIAPLANDGHRALEVQRICHEIHEQALN